jgi:hypothetical protein
MFGIPRFLSSFGVGFSGGGERFALPEGHTPVGMLSETNMLQLRITRN